jgi:hypothetical protein
VIAKGRAGGIAAGSVPLVLLALNDKGLSYMFKGGAPVAVPLSALA